MSGNLAPSKSTVYISNLPYSLTNNDLHQILRTHGKIVKVTIVKNKESRKSKGVAFVLFLDRTEARNCAKAMNNTQLFGRTVKASIAKDNGRAAEFIRRREYCNKTRCYECGEFGHLSYQCPRNALGEREPPPKKKRTRKRSDLSTGPSAPVIVDRKLENTDYESNDEGEDEALDSWSSVINFQASLATTSADQETSKKKIVRQAVYFSDEDEYEEDGG